MIEPDRQPSQVLLTFDGGEMHVGYMVIKLLFPGFAGCNFPPLILEVVLVLLERGLSGGSVFSDFCYLLSKHSVFTPSLIQARFYKNT